MKPDELKKLACEIRKDVLTMLYTAGSGHPGSCLSCIELITALYFDKLRLRETEPDWAKRDRFVLAKGHAAPVMYAALARKGFFPQEELLSLRQLNSRLQGHPDATKTPGVDASTGSLGQGLSIANGLALAAKLRGESWRTYALLGDGECQEGQVWEAAMLAAHYELDNLLAIIDHNGLQIDGPVKDVMDLKDLVAKWQAFGWDVWTINGHDLAEICRVIDEAWHKKNRPKVIIAETVKGCGVSFMENEVSWHGRPLTEPEYKAAMAELQECAPLMTALVSSRDVYGDCLVDLGRKNERIVVLDGDLASATTSNKFADAFPDRFFNVGIAEQNLVGTAAGLALAGFIPVASTFAMFGTGRAYEQVRNSVAYSRLNVKLICSHSGITCGPDGGSHQSIEDLTLMRGLPGMTVLVPADPVQAKWAIETAINTSGPVYVRLSRWKTKGVYQKGKQDFQLGKAHVLRDGEDIVLVSTGVLLGEVLAAADTLQELGIKAMVVDMPTLKPFDNSRICELAEKARAIFTIEDHSIIGGLGSAVAEALAENSTPCLLRRLGIRDSFGCSGSAEELLHHFQLDAKGIVEQVKGCLQKR